MSIALGATMIFKIVISLSFLGVSFGYPRPGSASCASCAEDLCAPEAHDGVAHVQLLKALQTDGETRYSFDVISVLAGSGVSPDDALVEVVSNATPGRFPWSRTTPRCLSTPPSIDHGDACAGVVS